MTKYLLAIFLLSLAACTPVTRSDFPDNCRFEQYYGPKNDVVVPCRIQLREEGKP